jgi:hypothetical protein
MKYAKKDNEDLYNELFDNKTIFDNKLNTKEIAKHFKQHFGNKWVCQKGKLYFYNGVYWKSEDITGKMPNINNFISLLHMRVCISNLSMFYYRNLF